MKKIFTFAAAILASMAMMAQTTNEGDYSTQVISSDATTSTWTFILPSSQTNVPVAGAEDNGIIYEPSGNGNMKFTSSNQFSWKGASSGYIPVPAGGAGTISMTVKGSSDSRWLQLYVNGTEAAASKRLWSKYNATATDDGKKGPQSFEFTADDLTTKNGKTYLHFKDNNTEMKIASFTVVLTSGLYGEASTDPNAYVDKDALDLKLGRTGLEQKKDSFVLKGENLPEDATATIDFPSHAGLSIEPATFAISEGKINQKFVVTYAPTDFAEFEDEITITASTFVIKVALACNKLEPQAALVPVDGDIEWDFSAAYTASIQSPNVDNEYIFANVSDAWANDFAADKLAGRAQYFWYKDNKCFQGHHLRFVTSVPGSIVVVFSNTGSGTRPYRHLFVNNVDTELKSKTTDKITSDPIDVPAGEIKLEGMMEDSEDPTVLTPNMLRIYKVTFIKGEEQGLEDIDASVKAVKIMHNGQLLIKKGDVFFNAQGAVVK